MARRAQAKPRALFEEVSAPRASSRAAAAADPGAAERRKRRARLWVGGWLLGLAALVCAMVLVGGMTRLTDSGLSMVSWRPVMGAVPPLSDADWAVEFEKYRQTAQFRLVNSWMTVEDFKSIYWWEWGHRQFGRAIGLVWALGLAVFSALRMVPRGYWGAVILPGLLGGAQGVIGWWMVESGVAEGATLVSVAPYRLTLHLSLAFVILGLLLWPAWRLLSEDWALLQARRRRASSAMWGSGALVALTFAQIALGALVAGNDAGRGYTDWPLMDGAWFPAGAFELAPLWRNFVETDGLVQFNHRVAGYALGLWALIYWATARRAPGVGRWAAWATLAIFLQMGWGVLTVTAGAPLEYALLHQAGALATFALALRARFEAAYPPEVSVRGRRR